MCMYHDIGDLRGEKTAHVSLQKAVAASGAIFLYSSQTDSWVHVRINKTFLEFDFGDDDDANFPHPRRRRSRSCNAKFGLPSYTSTAKIGNQLVSNSEYFKSNSSDCKSNSSDSQHLDWECSTNYFSQGGSSSMSFSELSTLDPSPTHSVEEVPLQECQSSDKMDLCRNTEKNTLPADKESETLLRHTQAPYLALMIRGLPCSLTQQEVINILDNTGLQGKYNFFYLPKAGNSVSNLGYAFVNFVDADSANICISALQGKMLSERSGKVCKITSANIQGLPKLRAHFRRSTYRRASKPIFIDTTSEKTATVPVQTNM